MNRADPSDVAQSRIKMHMVDIMSSIGRRRKLNDLFLGLMGIQPVGQAGELYPEEIAIEEACRKENINNSSDPSQYKYKEMRAWQSFITELPEIDGIVEAFELSLDRMNRNSEDPFRIT